MDYNIILFFLFILVILLTLYVVDTCIICKKVFKQCIVQYKTQNIVKILNENGQGSINYYTSFYYRVYLSDDKKEKEYFIISDKDLGLTALHDVIVTVGFFTKDVVSLQLVNKIK